MEEVDKILIQSLVSLGCDLDQSIVNIGQLDQDMFIESVANLLNTINGESSEKFPTKLPPNTGVKFRICSKFAAMCQQMGYKNEIGYQTFLYSNENETRRLLTFLIEKINKDFNMFQDQQSAKKGTTDSKKANKLKAQLSNRVKNLFGEFWLPPAVKFSSLRIDKDSNYNREGCRGLNSFNAIDLSIPCKLSNPKVKCTPEELKFYQSYCRFVSQQANSNPTDFIASLIEFNSNQKIKENILFKSDLNNQDKIAEKKANMNELRKVITKSVTIVNEHLNLNRGEKEEKLIREVDLIEIEQADNSQLTPNKLIKGSRFTHAQNLQFNKNDAEKVVSVIDRSVENKEEIENLKNKLTGVERQIDETTNLIDELNQNIVKLEETYKEQLELNKKLEESIAVKKRTINLINDAPNNILKLKDEINDHEKKMDQLRSRWLKHKEPLENENEKLKDLIENKKLEYQNKMQETRELRKAIDELNADLTEKEAYVNELNQELSSSSTKELSRSSNRQFYTKRILEIVEIIDRQRKEINKILIETRGIQKDINQLSGKLERVFNSADELLFKDAKKDEINKKVYKLFISINNNYEELIKTLEQSSQIEREIIDLEDQVNTESQNKIADNMEKVLKDLNQIKDENEKLIVKLKQLNN